MTTRHTTMRLAAWTAVLLAMAAGTARAQEDPECRAACNTNLTSCRNACIDSQNYDACQDTCAQQYNSCLQGCAD